MILGFSTQINGKPTHFVEKIHSGMVQFLPEIAFGTFDCSKYEFNVLALAKSEPKIHTIRKDKTNRWKVGMIIDFFINVRKPNMYRFAPQTSVVSIQNIEIVWHSESRSLELSKIAPKRLNYVDVIVDNNVLNFEEVKALAQNDGFEDIYDFFFYFNQEFTGKIIHWTDKRY